MMKMEHLRNVWTLGWIFYVTTQIENDKKVGGGVVEQFSIQCPVKFVSVLVSLLEWFSVECRR